MQTSAALREISNTHEHSKTSDTKAYFRSKRVFYHAALDQDVAGWCFEVRGGRVYGPFESRSVAEYILGGLIESFKRTGDTGGR